jgi:hypothetical protein
VIRFFTLQKLKAKDIHTERESVYGRVALALPTVKKWRGSFNKGEQICLTTSGPEAL